VSDRLTPQRETEIATRAAAATKGPWSANNPVGVVTNEGGDPLAVFGGCAQDRAEAEFVAHAREDVPALLAELTAVRAERDQAQARVAELEEASRQGSDRWRARCDHIARQGLRWKAEAEGRKEYGEKLRARVAELEAAQVPAAEVDDPDDNRRRLYVDGKGNGWISVCADEGTEWVVPVQPEAAVEQDVRDIADETGSLREIGRCW
jgi:hypothetical protein